MNLGYFCGRIIYDEAGKQVDIEFVDVNTVFEKMVGITAREMIGNRVSKLLYAGGHHDYDISKLLSDIKDLDCNQEIEIHKSTVNKWYRFHKISFENDFIGVTMEDITEIKTIYNEKKENEQMLGAVLDAADDAMFLINVTDINNIYYVINNDIHKKMMGVNIKKNSANRIEDYFSDKDTKIFKEKIMECIKSKDKVIHESQINNDEIILTTLTPLFKKGNITYILGTRKDISKMRKIEKQIKDMDSYDQITGLYNSLFFEKALKKYDYEEYLPISILIGDVDGITLTNNAFGYSEGYDLLKNVAKVIMGVINTKDIVARIGDDRFGIILTNTTSYDAEIFSINLKKILSMKESKLPLHMTIVYNTKDKKEQDLLKMINKLKTEMGRQKLYEGQKTGSYSLNVILNALFEKSQIEFGHSNRVSDICKKIAEKMYLSNSEINKMSYCGLVHDIGKVTIPEHILNKPGKLENDEWIKMKGHSEKGYNILSSTDEFSELAKIILYHHERWDGSGYPKGIRGEEIPMGARIIAVVDAYDAMTQGRPYKDTISKKDAVHEIEVNAGIQFDPKIVKVFIQDVCENL